MTEDDILWVEEINNDQQPLIAIYKDKSGAISFASRLSPARTARTFAGLLNYILENELGQYP